MVIETIPEKMRIASDTDPFNRDSVLFPVGISNCRPPLLQCAYILNEVGSISIFTNCFLCNLIYADEY